MAVARGRRRAWSASISSSDVGVACFAGIMQALVERNRCCGRCAVTLQESVLSRRGSSVNPCCGYPPASMTNDHLSPPSLTVSQARNVVRRFTLFRPPVAPPVASGSTASAATGQVPAPVFRAGGSMGLGSRGTPFSCSMPASTCWYHRLMILSLGPATRVNWGRSHASMPSVGRRPTSSVTAKHPEACLNDLELTLP